MSFRKQSQKHHRNAGHKLSKITKENCRENSKFLALFCFLSFATYTGKLENKQNTHKNAILVPNQYLVTLRSAFIEKISKHQILTKMNVEFQFSRILTFVRKNCFLFKLQEWPRDTRQKNPSRLKCICSNPSSKYLGYEWRRRQRNTGQ